MVFKNGEFHCLSGGGAGGGWIVGVGGFQRWTEAVDCHQTDKPPATISRLATRNPHRGGPPGWGPSGG